MWERAPTSVRAEIIGFRALRVAAVDKGERDGLFGIGALPISRFAFCRPGSARFTCPLAENLLGELSYGKNGLSDEENAPGAQFLAFFARSGNRHIRLGVVVARGLEPRTYGL